MVAHTWGKRECTAVPRGTDLLGSFLYRHTANDSSCLRYKEQYLEEQSQGEEHQADIFTPGYIKLGTDPYFRTYRAGLLHSSAACTQRPIKVTWRVADDLPALEIRPRLTRFNGSDLSRHSCERQTRPQHQHGNYMRFLKHKSHAESYKYVCCSCVSSNVSKGKAILNADF